MKKYIILDMEENAPFAACRRRRRGLTDMKDRLTEFLKLAKALGLQAVMPHIILSSKHSTIKKETILIDYIDIPKEFSVLSQLPKNTPSSEIFIFSPECLNFSDTQLYREHKSQIDKIKLYIPYKSKYKLIAEEIVNSLRRPLCTIHIRRGDYLDKRRTLIENTSPENIAKHLANHTCSDIYIMTNEKSKTFFESLRISHGVKQYFDYEPLIALKDNYELYCVEWYILALSDIRISTFDTSKAKKEFMPYLNPQFFHDHLDQHPGYQ